MENCIFCKIVSGEIPSHKIYENKLCFVFLDINPLNPGHLVIIPKKHFGYIFELPKNLYTEIFEVAKKISQPLKKVTKARRIGMVVEGFGVDHVHLHLVPINKANELDPHRAKPGNHGELAELAKTLIKEINF